MRAAWSRSGSTNLAEAAELCEIFCVGFLQLMLFNFVAPRSRRRVVVHRPPLPRRSSSDLTLKNIWDDLVRRYFSDRLDLFDYSLEWSRRNQKRTLASCNIKRRRVVVARELDREELALWLEPLLYHELCHAVLGKSITSKDGRRAWHGREFRALERRHPGIAALDHWIKSGGWRSAVRSARARASAGSRAERLKKTG
jgi:hypothetical protein